MSEEKVEFGTEGAAMDYEIVINGVSYPNTIEADRRIDRTNLEEEFATQADKYAYYSTLAALARDQEAKMKRLMEIAYAQADHAARVEAKEAMDMDPKMKFTEKMYESMARTNVKYQQAQLAYFDARTLADLLRGATETFAQRKEMLISLGAHARVGATDLRILGDNVRRTIQKKEREPEVKEELVDDEIIETEITKTKPRRKPKK